MAACCNLRSFGIYGPHLFILMVIFFAPKYVNSTLITQGTTWGEMIFETALFLHIIVKFAYLLLSYSKFELTQLRDENAAVQARQFFGQKS
jgi:hypothetical protein